MMQALTSRLARAARGVRGRTLAAAHTRAFSDDGGAPAPEEGPAWPNQGFTRRVRTASAGIALGSTRPAELRDIVATAVASKQLVAAVEMLEQAGEAEARTGVDYLHPDVLHMALVAVTGSGGSMALADRLVALVLQAPETRLEARTGLRYLPFLANQPVPDHVRGLAFAGFVEAATPGAHATYVQAVVASKGKAALEGLVAHLEAEQAGAVAYAGMLRGLARANCTWPELEEKAWKGALGAVRRTHNAALDAASAGTHEESRAEAVAAFNEDARAVLDAYIVLLLASNRAPKAAELVDGGLHLPMRAGRTPLPPPSQAVLSTLIDALVQRVIATDKPQPGFRGERQEATQTARQPYLVGLEMVLRRAEVLTLPPSVKRTDGIVAALCKGRRWEMLVSFLRQTLTGEVAARAARVEAFEAGGEEGTEAAGGRSAATGEAESEEVEVEESARGGGEGGTARSEGRDAARPVPWAGSITRVIFHRAILEMAKQHKNAEIEAVWTMLQELGPVADAAPKATADGRQVPPLSRAWLLSPSHVTYSLLLRHYAMNGDVGETKRLLGMLKERRMTPTYTAVLAVEEMRRKMGEAAFVEAVGPSLLGGAGEEGEAGGEESPQPAGAAASEVVPPEAPADPAEARSAGLDRFVEEGIMPVLLRYEASLRFADKRGRKEGKSGGSRFVLAHGQQEVMRAMLSVNKTLQEYFALGRPATAVRLLSDCGKILPRALSRADTFRTLATGLIQSGGELTAGWLPSSLPQSWGGSAATWAQVTAPTGPAFAKRIRIETPKRRKATEREMSERYWLDLGGLWAVLRSIRAAEYDYLQQHGVLPADNDLASALSEDNAVLSTPLSAPGLIAALRAFRVRNGSDPPDSGTEHVRMGGVVDHLPLLQFFTAEGLRAVADSEEPEDVFARRELAASASTIVWTAFERVPTWRALQAFLALYAGGAFGEGLTASPHTSVLLPATMVVDVRGVKADVAAVFVATVLADVARAHVLGMPGAAANGNGEPLSFLFVTGNRLNHTFNRLRRFFDVELQGGVQVDCSGSGILVTATSVQRWLESEREHSSAAAGSGAAGQLQARHQ